MDKQSLSLYHGGFLYNACTPLELRLNWCAHACVGCFANLNQPNRKAVVTQIFSMLQRHDISNTLEAYLLRQKYPVLISNHVDPFASNNADLSMHIINALIGLNIPCTIQTKGGKGLLTGFGQWDPAIDLIQKPTVFYVSIESVHDKYGFQWAPKAPSITSRLELVRELKKRGHSVLVGVNPVVPQWIPNPKEVIDTLAMLEVDGIWIQPLHLSPQQIAKMPQRDRDLLGEGIIDQAIPKNHKKYPAIQETLDALRRHANLAGLAVYDSQQRWRTDYFKPYKQLYPNRYPLMQDFVNHCWDTKTEGDLIYFEEWRDMMLANLPTGVWSIGQHIGAVAGPGFWSQAREESARIREAYGSANRMPYSELLSLIWNYQQSVLCPVNVPCFSWAAYPENKGWGRWIDDNDRPILVFNPYGESLWWECSL